MPKQPDTMNLDAELFAGALTDTTLRPRARDNMSAFLAAGGTPDLCIDARPPTARRASVWSRPGNVLIAAAKHGWNEAVADLLTAGADVHADNDEALYWAARHGHLPIVERLLAAGADATACNGWSLDGPAAAGHLPIIERLLAAAPATHACRLGALTSAARSGHLPVVERLLADGTDINTGEVLWTAASFGHLPIVERLLAAGADVHADSDKALVWAAGSGHLLVVDRLIVAGADVHARDNGALRASAGRHPPIVERLLAAGADVHANDDEALRRAADCGQQTVVGILLAAGADAMRVFNRIDINADPSCRLRIARSLDALAAAIPERQHQPLMKKTGHLMPALGAMVAAAQRRSATHPARPMTPSRPGA